MENNLRRRCINAVVALTLHFSPKYTELTINFLLNVSFLRGDSGKQQLNSAIDISSLSQIFMKNTILVIAVAVEMFSGRKLFEVHHAFRFNVISGFKNCHYKPICLLLSFEICCERQKRSGKNLKFDFPPVK